MKSFPKLLGNDISIIEHLANLHLLVIAYSGTVGIIRIRIQLRFNPLDSWHQLYFVAISSMGYPSIVFKTKYQFEL